MISEEKLCRVCHAQTEEIETIHDCRAEHLSMTDSPHRIRTENFILHRCPQCSHYQIIYCLPKEYYASYISTGMGQQQYSGALNQVEEKIQRLRRYSRNTSSIVEVGCGDITQGGSHTYQIAQTLYGRYVGVESSSEECRSAIQAGLPVVQGYFGPGLSLTQKFSAFMTFQVFEHLTDLYSVLNYALEILEPGGVGLINVPNGQRIVEENLYHQIIAEHVNYFTPESLATMAKRAGFDLIEIRAIPETVELDLYIRKPAPRKVSMDQTRCNQQQTLYTQLANSRCIGIWGAGGKAPIYGSLLSDDLPIAHLFDSSMEKAGKYIGNLPVPVEPVSSAALQECDVVLIFAAAYNTEIIKIL